MSTFLLSYFTNSFYCLFFRFIAYGYCLLHLSDVAHFIPSSGTDLHHPQLHPTASSAYSTFVPRNPDEFYVLPNTADVSLQLFTITGLSLFYYSFLALFYYSFLLFVFSFVFYLDLFISIFPIILKTVYHPLLIIF